MIISAWWLQTSSKFGGPEFEIHRTIYENMRIVQQLESEAVQLQGDNKLCSYNNII